MKLIDNGFLSLVDQIFWYLPFVSTKQAHSVREKANPAVTEENWLERFEFITAKHKVEGARAQLAEGWKSWLAARDPAAVDAEDAGGRLDGAAAPVEYLD